MAPKYDMENKFAPKSDERYQFSKVEDKFDPKI